MNADPLPAQAKVDLPPDGSPAGSKRKRTVAGTRVRDQRDHVDGALVVRSTMPTPGQSVQPEARPLVTGDETCASAAVGNSQVVPRSLPDLRHRPPSPVLPWPLRLQSWLQHRTQPGRSEAEDDARIPVLLGQLVRGSRVIAVIGPKGGVGKSTTALTLGLVLAQVPRARPILVELNPDWGTLDELLGGANPRTIQDLLRDFVAVERAGIGLLQGYVTMFGWLPVLTAPSDPDAMARLVPRDYDRALRLLATHYNVILLDCGTAFTQRLNQFAIQRADHLVVVGWPEQATMRKTLGAVEYLASSRYARDYRGVLDEGGRAEVRARALDDITLAINGAGHTGSADPVDRARVRDAAAGLNAVCELPFSPSLRRLLADGTLTIEALPRPYRRAMKGLLVAVLARLVDRGDV